MSKLEFGGYRDPYLEWEEQIRRSGPIAESAVQNSLKIYPPMFKQIGPDLRHIQTGETMEEVIAKRRQTHPHEYLDYVPEVTEEQVMHEVIEDACLRPSPLHVGRLFKLVGETKAKEILAQWGTDWVKMIPGERPGYAKKKEKTEDDGPRPSTNPWHPNFAGDANQRAAEQARIIKTGTKFALSMAKSAGVTLSGQPLRK
jgi:hypothetical protein